MDPQNQQNLTQHKTSPFLKKITKFLLSVSVFSFLFSYCSSLYPFLHSTKFYFSSFPLQYLTHSLNKNYMFLICNAILVLLAITSSWIRISSTFDLKDQLLKKIEDGDLTIPSNAQKDSLLENEILADQSFEPSQNHSADNMQEQKEDAEEQRENLIAEERPEAGKLINLDEGQEKESAVLNAVKEEAEVSYIESDEGNQEELQSGILLEEEEEEEEENGLSTEEMNKKFDEFIGKMKEELRIEARQQLVMV